jgi:hypothetical protein
MGESLDAKRSRELTAVAGRGLGSFLTIIRKNVVVTARDFARIGGALFEWAHEGVFGSLASQKDIELLDEPIRSAFEPSPELARLRQALRTYQRRCLVARNLRWSQLAKLVGIVVGSSMVCAWNVTGGLASILSYLQPDQAGIYVSGVLVPRNTVMVTASALAFGVSAMLAIWAWSFTNGEAWRARHMEEIRLQNCVSKLAAAIEYQLEADRLMADGVVDPQQWELVQGAALSAIGRAENAVADQDQEE